VIHGAHLATSIIENKCWEGLDRISDKTLTCVLDEGIKAVSLVRDVPYGLSMAYSYGHYLMLDLIR
jgi:hypothetical protein